MSILLARTAGALACLLLLPISSSRAGDVYVMYDEAGMAHFSAHAVDARYRLLFRDLSARAGGARRAAQPTAEIRQALERAAQRHGVDYGLLHAVAEAESGFDVDAVSPKGAVGLMQLMPDTARRYGIPGTDAVFAQNLRKLDMNVDAGTRYLRDLLARYDGDLALVLAAYNAGEGAVQRAGNRVPNYAETKQYVRKIMDGYQPKPVAALPVTADPGTTTGLSVWTAQGEAQAVQRFEAGFVTVPPRRR